MTGPTPRAGGACWRAERYVAPGETAVWVPAGVAAVLLSRAGLDAYSRRRRGDDPQVDAVLVAMKLVALAHRATPPASAAGHARAPEPDTEAPSTHWMTPGEVAARLDVSPRTVRRYITGGRLPGRLLGGRWLVDPADLARFRPATPTA